MLINSVSQPFLFSYLFALLPVFGVALPQPPANYWYPNKFCTEDGRFLTRYFDPRHCHNAWNQLIGSSVSGFSDRPIRFLPPPHPPATSTEPHNDSQSLDKPFAPVDFQTPLRWTHRTCTIAIVLLSAFAPGELPLPVIQPAPPDDITTFGEISYWGGIAMQCLPKYEPAPTGEGKENFGSETGFAVIGRQGGVGIFVWDTDGAFNRRNGLAETGNLTSQGSLSGGTGEIQTS